MAITWKTPLSSPANPSASLASGGSLVIGDTYYIVVCATNRETYSGGKFPPTLRSAPSVETSATPTSGNQKIIISWDAVSGATHYNVYITKYASGDDRWWGKRINRLSDNASSYATTDELTMTLESEDLLDSGNQHDTFAIKDALPGVDKDLGEGYVEITGAVGTINEDDIFAVVPTGQGRWDGYWLILKGGLYITSGATGSLTFENGKRYSFLHNGFYKDSDDFVFSAKRIIFDITAWSLKQTFGVNSTLEDVIFLSKEVYNGFPRVSSILGADNYLKLSSGFTDNGGNVVKGCTLRIVSDVDVSFNVDGYCASFEYNAINSSWQNAYCDGYFWVHINHYEEADNIEIRDCVINKKGLDPQDIRVYYSWIDAFPFYDCDFPAYGNNNHPVVWWSNTQGYDNQIDIYRSISLNIINKNNEPLEDVTVKLYDKNNSLLFTETTDVNGDITKQDVVVTEITKTAGGESRDSDYNDLNPFTLEISKAGYETYKKKFTFDKKIEWVISLKRISINIDNEVIV